MVRWRCEAVDLQPVPTPSQRHRTKLQLSTGCGITISLTPPRFRSLTRMTVLHFGADSSVCPEFAPGVSPVECGAPRGEPLDDVAAAVACALDEPLDYPPLARNTTPGDQVVVVLGHDLPQTAQVTAAVIRALVDARVGPDGISVLQTQADVDAGAGDPRRLVPEPIRERTRLLTHDPADRHQLAYLAANDAGEPILLSRAIHNADLVLPIGCLHNPATAGYYGIHGTIYPTFSDEKTLRRFRSPGSLDADGRHKKGLVREVDQIAWLLGINFTIQLIPTAGDHVLHVLAGQSDAVSRRGHELYRAAWSCSVPDRADLVVAAIEGDCRQQSWENFGRALETAVALVEDGGAIVLCCDLADQPGPAMQRMAGAQSRHAALRRIRKERPSDALPAAQLAKALDQGKVYLLSRLDPSLVEELDMIHVADGDELTRLARQYQRVILLANAAHATVTLP